LLLAISWFIEQEDLVIRLLAIYSSCWS
jgi:hypothetical protein